MAQYLLSVHSVAGGAPEPMSDEQMQHSYQRVMALQAEMTSAGVRIFGGRLTEPETATIVRTSGGEVLTTDGPFVESKEHLGGFHIVAADDLDAALAWASPDDRDRRGADRGPLALRRTPGLNNVRDADADSVRLPGEAEIGRIFGEESGRSLATLIQEAFASALRNWPVDGPPPNPGGWITTTAGNRVVDRLRRESRGRELLTEVAMLTPGDDKFMPEEANLQDH